jgi:hypothetical protein
MTNEQQLPAPTRCYIDGCDRENELMLHVADDPWLGGDYCKEHARAIVASTPLILTCECPICGRARRVVSDHPTPILTGPGAGVWQPRHRRTCSTSTSRAPGLLCDTSAKAKALLRKLSTCHRHLPSVFAGTEGPFQFIGQRFPSSGSHGRCCSTFAETASPPCAAPPSSGRSSPTRLVDPSFGVRC